MWKRTMVLAFAAVAPLGAGVATAGRTPLAVSPGDPEGMALVEARCPTFSWAAFDGAEGYDLVVYAAEPQGTDAEPALRQTLAGGVTAWTPALDRCLERSGRYAWSIRARGPKGVTEWSPAAFFQVASAPSEPELGQILEVVQRYLAAEESSAGLRAVDDLPAGEEETAAGTRAAFNPGVDTRLLVEDGHIAVRRDGLGFVQLDTRDSTAPGASYCDHITDTGRMILVARSTPRLYICTTDGVTPAWKYISLP